jgi:hypothetical protein
MSLTIKQYATNKSGETNSFQIPGVVSGKSLILPLEP